MGAKRGERRQSAPQASPILWERMNHMENNDKVLEKVEDEKLEKTSGGAGTLQRRGAGAGCVPLGGDPL